MKRLIFLLLLIPQICFAQTMISNRDIKQHPATKLFISGNHLVSDFEDISSSNSQITKYADVKTVNEKSTTNPKYFPVGNDKGIYFDGSGDYITSALSTDTDMGTGSFTIDFWIYSNTPASNCHIGGINDNANGNGGGVHFVTEPRLYARINSATIDLIDSTYTGEKWNHVALVRNGNSWNLYVNGISKANATNSLSLTYAGTGIVLGRRMQDTSQQFKGYIQNFRVTKGKALWTSNFTPPALNSTYETDSYTKLYIKGHDIPVNTTSFTDTATAKTITTVGDTKAGYSRGVASYFDGTGDYAQIQPIIDLNTGDFTLEFWMNQTAAGNNGPIFSTAGSSSGNGYWIQYDGVNLGFATRGGSGAVSFLDSNVYNKWKHLALVKSGTVCSTYLNGIFKASAEVTIPASSGYLTLASYTNPSYYSQVYFQNFQISKGIARYTSNFTPPETEPIPDQYTKLLLKQKMLKIPDIATNKTITINGQTTAQNKYRNGKSSIRLETYNTDNIQLADSDDWYFNTGGSIDFWWQCPVTTNFTYPGGVMFFSQSQTALHWYNNIEYYTGNVRFDNMNASIGSRAKTWVANTWYHICLIYTTNNEAMIFINGVLYSKGTGVVHENRTEAFFMGGNTGSNYGSIRGNYQDFRVMKGKSAYNVSYSTAVDTQCFTPPRRSGAF